MISSFVAGDNVAKPEASGCCVPILLCHVIHGAPDFGACTINQSCWRIPRSLLDNPLAHDTKPRTHHIIIFLGNVVVLVVV